MKLPQIRMESQLAKIQIKQTNARLDIQQKQAELWMEQPKPEVSIRTTPSKLSIDQTKAWEDMNLLSVIKLNDRFAVQGLQAVKEGIAETAREGNELMKIENGGNPIATQAKRNSTPPMKALGIQFIPSHFSVKTDYQPAEVHIDVTTYQPSIDVKTNQPIFTYYPGRVETSLFQKSNLNIWVEGSVPE